MVLPFRCALQTTYKYVGRDKDCLQSLKNSANSSSGHAVAGIATVAMRTRKRGCRLLLPSSPRRVSAKLTGGVLKFAQRLYVALSVACGRETPSVTYGDSSLGEGAFGFVQISDIGMPSSPRRVSAKLTGGVLAGIATIAIRTKQRGCTNSNIC